MIAVSNTSPLLFFNKINSLSLITQCFTEVYIPHAVIRETHGLILPQGMISKPVSLIGASFVHGALGYLHEGELEAITLAQEIKVDYVLLDDLAARRKAVRLGLPVMGTVGILLLAHKLEFISGRQAVDYLNTLIYTYNMYLSESVRTAFSIALKNQEKR